MKKSNTPARLALLFSFAALTGCSSNAPAPKTPTSAPQPAQPAPAVFTLAAEVADVAEKPPADAVRSNITKVTVYSDRALVTREASVKLAGEPTVHRFMKLPGWVDEGSVRASTSVGKIVDISVDRRFLARSSDEGFRNVEKKHKALLRQLQAVDDELEILRAQKNHVQSIKVFSLEKLTKDATTRDIKVGTYGEVIDFVSGSLRSTAEARRQVQAKREQLVPEVAASNRNLDELRRLTKLEETTVAVTLQGTAGSAAKLNLSYATPGATWEPMHELRASSKQPESVELNSFAVVTQTTGEDWSQAELFFSTQSSSDTERIPELEMLALGKTQQTTRQVTRRDSSFSRAQQKYQQQNRFWNTMNQARSKKQSVQKRFEKTYTSNLEYFERVQSKTVEIFQGLQKRGTTAHFVAKDPTIVRSDGRSIRLRIGNSRIKAQRQIIAAPEESLNAAVTLKMLNNGNQPLLPGSVARYRDGAFLGMTDVKFVSKGEEFSMFFSVADQVKLTRSLDRKRSSLSRKTRNRMQLSFVSTAKNLSDRAITMVLAERIPVSENSDIRVSGVRITPKAKADVKGIVRWTVTLKPGEERVFRVSYQVDYPPTLVLDVQRRRRKHRKRPARPSPAQKQHMFEDNIIEMEQML